MDTTGSAQRERPPAGTPADVRPRASRSFAKRATNGTPSTSPGRFARPWRRIAVTTRPIGCCRDAPVNCEISSTPCAGPRGSPMNAAIRTLPVDRCAAPRGGRPHPHGGSSPVKSGQPRVAHRQISGRGAGRWVRPRVTGTPQHGDHRPLLPASKHGGVRILRSPMPDSYADILKRIRLPWEV